MFRTARPPLLRDLSCPACAGRAAWKVDPVRELGPGDPVMPAWWDAQGRAVGRFAVWACEGCGLCEWWAHELGGAQATPPSEQGAFPKERACPSCSSRSIHVVPMRDAVSGGDPVPMRAVAGAGSTAGRLHALVCAGCGHTRWVVAGLDRLLRDGALAPAARTCTGCGGGFVWATWAADAAWLSPTRDQSPHEVPATTTFSTRRLARQPTQWLATLRLHLCSDCTQVTWFATGLDTLVEDREAGIVRFAAPDEG